jgi:hypothetical protein
MKAKVGDFLVIKGTTVEMSDQRGEITEVRSGDGSPPYVVRWLSTDHIATVLRSTAVTDCSLGVAMIASGFVR